MRKLIAFALAALVAALPAVAQAQASDGLKLGKDEAFVLVNGLPLYQEQGGALKWKEGLTLGDKVQLKSGVQKKKVEGKERDYVKVKAPSGNEGFVRSQFVAAKAGLAVVKADKTSVYSEPRDVKITARTIGGMTLLAVLQDGSGPAFAKVVGYDAAQDAYYTDPVYVATEDLSSAEADVNSVILFAAAKAAKSKDVKDSLFKVIQKRYSSSIFFAKIQAALASSSPATQSKPTEPAGASFVVNDDHVNVRSQPDEVNGQVVAQLDRGKVVEVVEQTSQSYTVGGSTDRWFRIAEPAGWIFGAFLDPSD